MTAYSYPLTIERPPVEVMMDGRKCSPQHDADVILLVFTKDGYLKQFIEGAAENPHDPLKKAEQAQFIIDLIGDMHENDRAEFFAIPGILALVIQEGVNLRKLGMLLVAQSDTTKKQLLEDPENRTILESRTYELSWFLANLAASVPGQPHAETVAPLRPDPEPQIASETARSLGLGTAAA